MFAPPRRTATEPSATAAPASQQGDYPFPHALLTLLCKGRYRGFKSRASLSDLSRAARQTARMQMLKAAGEAVDKAKQDALFSGKAEPSCDSFIDNYKAACLGFISEPTAWETEATRTNVYRTALQYAVLALLSGVPTREHSLRMTKQLSLSGIPYLKTLSRPLFDPNLALTVMETVLASWLMSEDGLGRRTYYIMKGVLADPKNCFADGQSHAELQKRAQTVLRTASRYAPDMPGESTEDAKQVIEAGLLKHSSALSG